MNHSPTFQEGLYTDDVMSKQREIGELIPFLDSFCDVIEKL